MRQSPNTTVGVERGYGGMAASSSIGAAWFMDIGSFRESAKKVEKFPYPGDERSQQSIDLALGIASRIGHPTKPGSRVLDLGCGIGDSVRLMLAAGYDAYGVDIGEWWGKDNDAYWQDTPIPETRITQRLCVTDEKSYRLPYPDGHFDFAMSSQVFEHVFNYADVFRELARVLKPGAISVNIFPGRGTPFEAHLGIPVTAFAHNKAWVAGWSLLVRKHRKSWADEYRFLRGSMASNSYPSRRQLIEYGKAAGVRISFAEREYIECSNSRPTKLLQSARRVGFGWALAPVLERTCQRTMIVSRNTA